MKELSIFTPLTEKDALPIYGILQSMATVRPYSPLLWAKVESMKAL